MSEVRNIIKQKIRKEGFSKCQILNLLIFRQKGEQFPSFLLFSLWFFKKKTWLCNLRRFFWLVYEQNFWSLHTQNALCSLQNCFLWSLLFRWHNNSKIQQLLYIQYNFCNQLPHLASQQGHVTSFYIHTIFLLAQYGCF